ncbi:hypothetical protein Dsin_028087 [Dipteronia sinensis]|uniref:PGG domain-containing protein n=1 Tax=Dipteronia sinensis TaxID=43782 RepID=A0AAD9ZRK0_9ROSI|nr:hypothetical protein Dsin_028087 [Dipteronia sinensis]
MGQMEEASTTLTKDLYFKKRTKELYDAVLKKDWETMKKRISKEKDVSKYLQPISMHQDNIIHLAVHSKKVEPLQQILDIVDNDEQRYSVTSSVNAYGNTVLHEAAICRNYQAVKLLVKKNKELIDMKNNSGETPLFRAAAYGNTKIVKYLISQPGQRVLSFEHKVQLKGIHRSKNDGASILRAAIEGKQFGTALELLELDEELTGLDDKNGSSLYMLAQIPSVFKSRRQMGIWKRLFYHCLPVVSGYDDSIDKIKEDEDPDIESGLQQNLPAGSEQEKKVENGKSGRVYKGWSVARRLWKEKREYELAPKLARILIRNDKSFNQNCMQFMNEDRLPDEKKEKKEPGNPLFAAIRTGNVELVKFILKEHPQAHEQINHKKQNILHVAAMHREKEIFDLVKSKEVPMVRLARQTDINGNTVLHSVADTLHYKGGGARSGPAYQLLEELKWFKDVEKIIPSYYTMLPNNNNMTAREVFEAKHKIQHEEAQQWLKDTSEKCSVVAVLVSGVVFAAAFTVPGGTNDKNGRPILINSPFFLFFTISDIISLSCSLTAVVMFLGILTSSFDLENFLDTIPRKLTLGFVLLFMSVATTMLAFASTILLVIRLDERRRWTTTLICCASFFPVGVFALTHFPLFATFIKPWKYFFEHFSNWMARPRDRNLVARFLRFPQSKDKVDT